MLLTSRLQAKYMRNYLLSLKIDELKIDFVCKKMRTANHMLAVRRERGANLAALNLRAFKLADELHIREAIHSNARVVRRYKQTIAVYGQRSDFVAARVFAA